MKIILKTLLKRMIGAVKDERGLLLFTKLATRIRIRILYRLIEFSKVKFLRAFIT